MPLEKFLPSTEVLEYTAFSLARAINPDRQRSVDKYMAQYACIPNRSWQEVVDHLLLANVITTRPLLMEEALVCGSLQINMFELEEKLLILPGAWQAILFLSPLRFKPLGLYGKVEPNYGLLQEIMFMPDEKDALKVIVHQLLLEQVPREPMQTLYARQLDVAGRYVPGFVEMEKTADRLLYKANQLCRQRRVSRLSGHKLQAMRAIALAERGYKFDWRKLF